MRPPSSRSRRMGLRSIGWPTMLKVVGVQLSEWLWATVSRPATPGSRFLYPPPKLAMMCGSMHPSETTRSAWATVLWIHTGVPRLVVPSETSRSASSQAWFSQRKPASPALPTRWAISASCMGRCSPSAVTSVTSSRPTPPCASSSSTAGRRSATGVGRLKSSITSATCILLRTISRRCGVPTGSCRLRRTSSAASFTPAREAGSSTPARCQSRGRERWISSFPFSYPPSSSGRASRACQCDFAQQAEDVQRPLYLAGVGEQKLGMLASWLGLSSCWPGICPGLLPVPRPTNQRMGTGPSFLCVK